MANSKSTTKHITYRWPEGAIVYQIYPRSFQDSNGDGIGDLPGIITRLDYLKELGVTAIWLSPFYPSPMADFGYDVADYCNVDPMFGTMADFEHLLTEIHKRSMRLIIDFVPNHSSDEHQWFKDSRRSNDTTYADWYIWQDAAGYSEGGDPLPPNNWLDALSGDSAWQWEPARHQFYLHSFHRRQPDLNWSNPAVREAMKDAMRYWLRLGVDGFRVDAVYWMGKNPLFKDDDVNPDYISGEDLTHDAVQHNNSRGWPFVYSYLAEMADVLKEPAFADSPRFMVTEAYPERDNLLASYLSFYVSMDPLVAAPFNFEGISMPWAAQDWRNFLTGFHQTLRQFSSHSVASYAFGNHGQSRLASRLGDAAARSAAVMQFTLPGMIFIYYGEEIGMQDQPIATEDIQDPAAKGDPKHNIGRDPERTPMQWDPADQAGFSTAQATWLPVAANYRTRNVLTESADPSSFLLLYKSLSKLRTSSDILKYGDIEIIDVEQPDVLAYFRCTNSPARYLTVVNFSDQPQQCQLPYRPENLMISSAPQTNLIGDITVTIDLAAHEAAVFYAPQPPQSH